MMTEEEIREFLEGREEKKAVVKRVRFQPLKPVTCVPTSTGINRLKDVEVTISAELSQRTLKVREIINLSVGSVVELTKPAGDFVEVMVNNQLFARGEVMVYGDNFEIRISSIHSPPFPGRDRG